jgi:hypothetical protein
MKPFSFHIWKRIYPSDTPETYKQRKRHLITICLFGKWLFTFDFRNFRKYHPDG